MPKYAVSFTKNGIRYIVRDVGAQRTLISGTNIKTVNGQSLLGSGNIQISGGSSYFAGTGISITNDTINHSNSVTAQSTPALRPIGFDSEGHISSYGSPVSIPTKTSDLTNDSGYLTLATLPIYDGTVV